MSKILVLDANERSALAAIRTLGRNENIKVYAADSSIEAIGGSSRFCHKYLIYPSIYEDPQSFVSWLLETLKDEAIEMVFPMTEISSQLLLMQNHWPEKVTIPFADYQTVMSLTHKGNLAKLAELQRIPCPNSKHYQEASEVDISKVNSFPVVVKPCLSRIWQDNYWIDTVVEIADSVEQLDDILTTRPWLQAHEFMVQEFIQGYGAGLFALYDLGEPVCFFAHKRLREKPPQGGVSVLSESVPLDPKLVEIAKRLLDTVNWHGVAMIEFRIAQDGTPYLMEVNTRFWGSLQLAIDAGVNFPDLLYRISRGEKIVAQTGYKPKIRLRWFLGDLDSLYLVLKSPHYSLLEKFKRVGDFFTPHFLSTRHEVNRCSDIRPALTELKQYIKDLTT